MDAAAPRRGIPRGGGGCRGRDPTAFTTTCLSNPWRIRGNRQPRTPRASPAMRVRMFVFFKNKLNKLKKRLVTVSGLVAVKLPNVFTVHFDQLETSP